MFFYCLVLSAYVIMTTTVFQCDNFILYTCFHNKTNSQISQKKWRKTNSTNVFENSTCQQESKTDWKTTLTPIRAARDRHLRNEPYNKLFSVIGSAEVTEANKALNSLLKSLSKSGKTSFTFSTNALTTEAD